MPKMSEQVAILATALHSPSPCSQSGTKKYQTELETEKKKNLTEF